MATLYIDRRNIELALDGDTLVCRDAQGRAATIPLAPVDRVYMRSGIRLTSGVLAALGARDVAVVILHGSKGVPVLFHPRPHRDARLRCAQYRLLTDDALRLRLAQLVVAGKIAGQIELLSDLAHRRPKHAAALTARAETLESMRRQTPRKKDLNALRGLEGAASQHYFAALAGVLPEGLGFSGRNRRPPRDPVNAALSLGYTLLHAEAVIAVYGHGFDPYIGFYHGLDYGRESLACDVVEPLRTEVDAFVIALFLERRLRPEHFSTGPHGCLMGKAGRHRFYQDFERAAERIRRRFDELLSALADTLLEKAPPAHGDEQPPSSANEDGKQ